MNCPVTLPILRLSTEQIQLKSFQSVFIESISSSYYFTCREAYIPGCSCHIEKSKTTIKSYKKCEDLLQIFRDPSVNISKLKEPRKKSSLKKKYVCSGCSTTCIRQYSNDSYLQCKHLRGLCYIKGYKHTLDMWIVNNEDNLLTEGTCISLMGGFYNLLDVKEIGDRIIGIPVNQILIFDYAIDYTRTANVSYLLYSIENYRLKLPDRSEVKPTKGQSFCPNAISLEMKDILNMIDEIYKHVIPYEKFMVLKLVLTLGVVNSVIRDIANFYWSKQQHIEPEQRIRSLSSYCLTQFPCERSSTTESNNAQFLFSLNLLLIVKDIGLILKVLKSISISIKGIFWLESVYDTKTIEEYIRAGMCNILIVQHVDIKNNKEMLFLERLIRYYSMTSVWLICEKDEFESLFFDSKKALYRRILKLFDIALNINEDVSVDLIFDFVLKGIQPLPFFKIKTKRIIKESVGHMQVEKILQRYYLERRKLKNTSQEDLSLMAKLAYIFHFFRALYLMPLQELIQSLEYLDTNMWSPIDIVIAIFLFEETYTNKHKDPFIDRFVIQEGKCSSVKLPETAKISRGHKRRIREKYKEEVEMILRFSERIKEICKLN